MVPARAGLCVVVWVCSAVCPWLVYASVSIGAAAGKSKIFAVGVSLTQGPPSSSFIACTVSRGSAPACTTTPHGRRWARASSASSKLQRSSAHARSARGQQQVSLQLILGDRHEYLPSPQGLEGRLSGRARERRREKGEGEARTGLTPRSRPAGTGCRSRGSSRSLWP